MKSKNNGIIGGSSVDKKTLEVRAELQNQFNCMRTYSINNPNEGLTIYSVDSMMTYVNTFKPKIQENVLTLKNLKEILSERVWSYTNKQKKEIDISPMEVIENIDDKMLAYHAKKIKFADTSFPIFMELSNYHYVVDGFHRLAQLYMRNKDKQEIKIKFYGFSPDLMKNFLIVRNMDPKDLKNLSVSIEAIMVDFFNNFCRTPK